MLHLQSGLFGHCGGFLWRGDAFAREQAVAPIYGAEHLVLARAHGRVSLLAGQVDENALSARRLWLLLLYAGVLHFDASHLPHGRACAEES